MFEKPPKAVVEAGHSYSIKDTRKLIEHPEMLEREIEIAERVAVYLLEKGYENSKMILLDEVKPNASMSTSEDRWRWRMFIGRDIQNIEKVMPKDYKLWVESDYERSAKELIGRLKDRIRTGQVELPKVRLSGKEGNRIKVGSDKGGQDITLLQRYEEYGSTHFIPSCPVLDLAVYKEKLKDSTLAVTILPLSFKGQQAEVRSLFKILGEDPPVIVLYFDENFKVVESESWNSANEGLARELKEI